MNSNPYQSTSKRNRRDFVQSVSKSSLAVAGMAFWNPASITQIAEASSNISTTPDEAAQDESFWMMVQNAYTSDRTLINLNNGGVSPAPKPVQDSMKRYLDYSNTAPTYTMWEILEPQREGVREKLADMFRCGKEEIALTRNASEGLQICQQGFDLQAGDEVLATDQDYPRMISTFKQMERRYGIVLKQFPIPTPCEDPDEIVSLYEEHITQNTKLILISHVVFMTGQIMPVKPVVQMARNYRIPVIVDGAHAFGQFSFTHDDLDCDYYATSLHKWLGAPHGTGMLYVNKDKIGTLWALTPADQSMDNDIRKFEEIGTHPAANYLAIGDAIAFYHGMGPERKEARLRYLRDRWAKRLMEHPKVKLHTSLKPEYSCAFATLGIEGIDSQQLADYLWNQHRIIVTSIKHKEFEGIRVSSNVYTTLKEIDYFSEVMENVIQKGI